MSFRDVIAWTEQVTIGGVCIVNFALGGACFPASSQIIGHRRRG